MTSVSSTLEYLKAHWSTPKTAVHGGSPVPVPLVCSFEPPATQQAVSEVQEQFCVPTALLDFWRLNDGASLFEDPKYGQWGLRFFATADSILKTKSLGFERAMDCKPGDLVIAEFLGDSDRLIIRCDPSLPDYGNVIVALPIDERADWDLAAKDFEIFITRYADTQGEKYWRKVSNSRSDLH